MVGLAWFRPPCFLTCNSGVLALLSFCSTVQVRCKIPVFPHKGGRGELKRLADAITVRPLPLPIRSRTSLSTSKFIRIAQSDYSKRQSLSHVVHVFVSSCALCLHMLVHFQFSFCSRCDKSYKNNILRRERGRRYLKILWLTLIM